MIESTKRFEYPRPLIMAVAVFVLVLVATFLGYHYASSPSPQKGIAATALVKREEPKITVPEVKKETPDAGVAEAPAVPSQAYNLPRPKEQNIFPGVEPAQKAKMPPPVFERNAVVVVEGANLRSAPGRDALRVAVIFKDQTLKVIDQRLDKLGYKWYMVRLYGDKEGWISDEVVEIR